MSDREKFFFIEDLRIPLIILVVAHHAGQAYGWKDEHLGRTDFRLKAFSLFK